MTRVVIDANVLLAGTISAEGSPPAVLLNALEHEQVEVIASPQLLAELRNGLNKPFLC